MENKANKTYRIKTNINKDSNVLVQFTQEYETFELLSIKMKTENLYKLHNANYGVVVGRVQANGGFGVPNAKLSIFIEVDQDNENAELLAIYGYTDVFETNSLGNTYNLLPDEQVSDCHQKIGAFPSKRYLLDNDTYIDVFDKYYKYTTRTNNAGDYIIVGVPVGNQTLHMDLDLSDCGILSQRPRDFVYKGYNIEQFENPNQFKTATGASINFLSQYVQQTKTIYVNPLWGSNELGETIGVTRADVDVNFKFEPTCVFIGSIVSDSKSNGMSLKCIPTDQMGVMDELTTGRGTIEMIRKTPSGEVEEFQIKGNELIDGNGTWCYQIPMNLDYVTTNEFGETVATDNPNIGIPTRARVRFRIGLDNFEGNNDNYFAGKILVPNNPDIVKNGVGKSSIDYDYAFGTATKDDSYRDLFWNNVYSVKQHIPRIQKSGSWRTDRFTGIKQCNFYGQNNPIPYNSIRIKLPFMFIVLCALIKTYVRIVSFLNAFIYVFFKLLSAMLIFLIIVISSIMVTLAPIMLTIIAFARIFGNRGLSKRMLDAYNPNKWEFVRRLGNISYITIADGICPDLESWYFAPRIGKKDYCPKNTVWGESYDLCEQTIDHIASKEGIVDTTSNDAQNPDANTDKICITRSVDYLMSCIEMNLAQEYKVIKFDFYNDWINGLIYIPRWKYKPAHKITFLFGLIRFKIREKGCFDSSSIFGRSRRLTQHCSLGYSEYNFGGGYVGYAKVATKNGCSSLKSRQKCHKNPGIRYTSIFGSHGGLVHREKTMLGQTVYYYKPCELTNYFTGLQTKINIFATDLILLGSLNDCDIDGIPQAFKLLSSSSYKMPTNLALTNLDESGVLYVDNDSYCRGSSNIDSNKVSEASNSFSGQIAWSSSAPAEISIVGYGMGANSVESYVNTINDRVAITEAAGISWDYTGPGQLSPYSNDLFSPGGHFLGMSCINSKTNIKSCVNLQRICEAGVTMSERQENVRKLVKQSNGEYKPSYYVLSPTGLISNDEVIGESFRNMFATMNINKLIATKKDNETGYLKYDFKYLRSNGFEGGANKNIVSKASRYNTQIEYAPEEILEQALGDDYDEEELQNVFHRSIESSNLGYYRFRFGLRNSDTKEFKKEAASKYALRTGGVVYLPQYENSFYFYFGLKDGNTAMDRFYSDFFSMCPTRENTKRQNVSFRDGGIEYCNRKQAVWVATENVAIPYDLTLTNGNTTISAPNVTFQTVKICDLTAGDWAVSVSEKDGITINKKLKIGSNLKAINYDFYDFKEDIKDGFSVGYNHRPEKNGRVINGGVFMFNQNSVTVFGKSLSDFYENEKKNFDESDKFMGLLFVGKKEGVQEDAPEVTTNKSKKSRFTNTSTFGESQYSTLDISNNINDFTANADVITDYSSNKTIKTNVGALLLMYEGNGSFSTNTPFRSNNFYSASTDAYVTDFTFDNTYVFSNVDGERMTDFSGVDEQIFTWDEDTTYTLYFVYKCKNGSKFSALELCSFYSYGYTIFNVFVGSKYLKYNGRNREGFTLDGFFKTNNYTYSQLVSAINNLGNSQYVTQWALRQALFDQRYDISIESSDRKIRCTNLNGDYIDGIEFGQPERSVIVDDKLVYEKCENGKINNVINVALSTEDYSSYAGYEIDGYTSLLPSIGDINEEVKLPYYRMTYDEADDVILSKSIGDAIVFNVETTLSNNGKLEYTKISANLSNYQEGLTVGAAYILETAATATTDDAENETKRVECSCISASSTTAIFLIPSKTLEDSFITISKDDSYTIHPTLMVPIVHRPFYFECCAFFLGYFNAIGTSNLVVDINVETPTEDKEGLSIDGNKFIELTAGCRKLTYYLSPKEDSKNGVYSKSYFRIYGGNACGPDYLLSKDNCTINGSKLNAAISIKDSITSLDLNHMVTASTKETKIDADNIGDEITIKLSTGGPDLTNLKQSDVDFVKKELIAFNGLGENPSEDEINASLEVSTEHTVTNYLPKEIVIRKETDPKCLNQSYTGAIIEDRYLDIGDNESVTAEEVNENVKLYLVIIPDKEDNNSRVNNLMQASILPKELYSDDLNFMYFANMYIPKKSSDILMSITFADYFSNPSAVLFLIDQLIESSYISVHNSKWIGGYFEKNSNDDYMVPGLEYGTYSYSFIGERYYAKSPIIPYDTTINFDYKNKSYRGSDGVRIIGVKGSSSSYVDIKDLLAERVYDFSDGKKLRDYLSGTTLSHAMSNFGYTLDVRMKFNDSDINQYPTRENNFDTYYTRLTEIYGNLTKDFFEYKIKKLASTDILGYNHFDRIIGKNWSVPNIEFNQISSIGENVLNNIDEGDIDKFNNILDNTKELPSDFQIVTSHASRLNSVNIVAKLEEEREKNLKEFSDELEGEYNNSENPNYAKIIAKRFIGLSIDTQIGEDEADTIKKVIEANGESIILPLRLGKIESTENGSNKIMSSFILPEGITFSTLMENNKYFIRKDRKWTCDSRTRFANTHLSDAKEEISDIETAIFDENMSLGFRSVIIGIYNGNDMRETESGTGNLIRPVKIYTYHNHGLTSESYGRSKTSVSHMKGDSYSPNEYDLEKEGKKEITSMYYYETYNNDYDNYASGWC